MPDMPPITPRRRYARPPKPKTTERGYGVQHQKQRRYMLARHPVCQNCGGAWSEHLHHIDGNPHNRAESNLACWCQQCHMKYHARNG